MEAVLVFRGVLFVSDFFPDGPCFNKEFLEGVLERVKQL